MNFMTDLILHQYAASPFSEKVRCLLGYKRQSYRMVEIPVIMPKPNLMALTGGYRKTPVLQVGADVFCDTAIICRFIDTQFPEDTIYPKSQEAVIAAAVHWTDTFLFKVSVAVAFQPKAVAGSELFGDEETAVAFMADRAALSKGSTELTMDLGIAQSHWSGHLKRLDSQLASASFLGGDKPDAIDFSSYHCCWFVYKNDVLKSDLDNYSALPDWMGRMAAFGQGQPEMMTGDEAVEIARGSAISVDASTQTTLDLDGAPSLGDVVEVMPIDYGFQPTRGELLVSSAEEWVVKRDDERAGEVAVHFPRTGFQVNRADP